MQFLTKAILFGFLVFTHQGMATDKPTDSFLKMPPKKAGASKKPLMVKEKGGGYTIKNVSGTLFEQMGLKDGDTLLSINGKDIGPAAFAEIIGGDKADIRLLRKGKLKTITYKVKQ